MGKSTIELSAVDQTKAAFDSVKRGLDSIDSKVGLLKGTFSAFTAIFATAGLTDVFKQTIEAASKAEQSSNRLNAVIRATGDASGFTRGQLDLMAESLAKATTFDDDGIREAQANLMKFGRLHGEVFEKALKLSADYAAFTGGSMVEATQLIGKALADPVNGVTALGKSIGKLSETEKEAISTAMEHGQVAEAQAVIFAKLERSIGGTAGALNQGIYGATTAAGKAWDDFLKALGKTGPIQITTTGALHLIADGLDLITEAIKKQNDEFKKNPLYNGGKLQPLPEAPGGDPLKALQGSGLSVNDVRNLPPGLRPSIVPPGQNQMSTEEVRARGAAKAKEDEEAAQARAEAAFALEKTRQAAIKKADDSFWELARAKIDANDQWNKGIDETIKATRALEDAQQESSLKYLEAQAQQEIVAATQGQKNIEEYNKAVADKAKQQEAALASLQTGLLTENEVRKFAYDEDFNLLVSTLGMKADAQEQYYTLMGRLVLRNEKQRTAIEDAEIKKRTGVAHVYRKLDLDSAGYFADQMGALMATKSRALFEVGKAGAIASTIIKTYEGAQDAFTSLAKIPIVGPALGAAAAAAAIAVGFARVSAIKSTSFGSGGGGAVGTFSANPNTGLPDAPSSSAVEQVAPTQTVVPQRKDINITILGEGMFSAAQIRDSLIPALNEAIGDGVQLRVMGA